MENKIELKKYGDCDFFREGGTFGFFGRSALSNIIAWDSMRDVRFWPS
jgi:hypothetical protein